MKWETIRQQFPDEWVLVEATKAHSIPGKRIVEELALLNTFANSCEAMDAYAALHRQNPQRELYYLHTSRERLDIEARYSSPRF